MAKSTRKLVKRRKSTRKANALFTEEHLKREQKRKKKIQDNKPGSVHPYDKFLIFIQTSRPLHIFHLLPFFSFLEIERNKRHN